MTGDNGVRHQAALAVMEITDQGGYASLVIDRTLKKTEASGTGWTEQERRFFTSLVYAVVRHQKTIDEQIGRVSRTPLSKMKPYIRACLRIGAAQLYYMDGVKPYAAVSESVELVKRSSLKGLAPFVNGVLRTLERGEKPQSSEAEEIPEWIRESLRADYGEERAGAYLHCLESVRPVCLRLNLLKGSREELVRELEENTSQTVIGGSFCDRAVYLKHSGDIGSSSMYMAGKISVQDESSMLAVLLLDPQPGEKILDLCAAPGGKTCMAAEMMQNRGSVDSRDLHEHRVRLIGQNAARLGLTVIRASVSDAGIPHPEDKGAYDRVLLDAPCSGLGIVRSKRDIAFRRSEEDIEQLTLLQQKLLETAADAVAQGGRLVYSTCTLTKKENERQVEAFLERHPEFELIDLNREKFGEKISGFQKDGERGMITLWPEENGHDGFFAAAMTRKH